MFEAGAIVAVLAGVFVGRVIHDLPPLVTRALSRLAPSRLGARTATLIGGWGTGLVVAVIIGSMLPAARYQERLERRDLTVQRARTTLIGHLSGLVTRVGAARILACGQPKIPIEYQSVLAWYLDVKVGRLYVLQSYIARHPHPLVNIYPIAQLGWKMFPSHVTPAAAGRCRGLNLRYRP